MEKVKTEVGVLFLMIFLGVSSVRFSFFKSLYVR
jgi:hypothetical protein